MINAQWSNGVFSVVDFYPILDSVKKHVIMFLIFVLLVNIVSVRALSVLIALCFASRDAYIFSYTFGYV